MLISSIFIIASCGGGGGGGKTTPSTPAPTVNLSAEPTSVLLDSASTLTWSSTNSTSCSATWTNATTGSGSEAVTITSAGNNTFSISCTGAGGAGSKSITVEGYRNIDGIVVDGYISGAEVFIDEDNDWIADSNESSTTSDNDGTFTIKYANGNLISIGGTDLDSQAPLDNLLIAHKLTAHSDFKAVTPVTSVATFMTDSSNINAALGIDSSIDIFTFDPVANRGDGGINDYLYEKGNQLTTLAYALQNITNNLKSTTETTQDYFKAIAEEIEKEFTETSTKVDIETESFIIKALDNVVAAKSVTISDEAEANTTKALSGIMPVIEVKSSTNLTTSVIRFAVSTLQTDIKAIANGTASSETITSYTENILSYIAIDQSIDSDQIAPDISAIADAITTSEDTAVEINVLANDSFLTSAPITVSSANGTNGSTEVLNNFITYTSDADYNGTDTFSYTITQGDKTSSADVSVTIEAIDDAPVFTSSTTFSAAENQTAIGTVTATDADSGDTVTFIVSGSELAITSAGVLTFASAPDYETKFSYTATVTASDGTNTTTQAITVSVTDVNESPAFASSASFSAAENQISIGTVSVSDPESQSITYSLSGTDASSLSISSSGVLTVVSAPNYEVDNSYSATVTVSDGTNSTAQNITVSVTDVNDSPAATAASYPMNLLPQSQTSGSLTLAGTDEDGDTLTYSIGSNGSYGTASLSGSTVSYQTSASTQSAQSESFTFKVNDGTVDSSAATISIDLRTDPLYQYQWHLNNTGQTNFATDGGTAGQDLNLDSVIVNGITGDGVTVAVIDGGLEIAHEDLAANIVTGSYDFVNEDEDPTNSANDGDHGTSVAGIIAAEGWNNKGGRGVAPNASLIGYNYTRTYTSESNQIKAWGTNPPVSVDVDIYNMSYGESYTTTYDLPEFLSSAKEAALINGTSLRDGKGAIYIQASGNDYGKNPTDDCGGNLSCTEIIMDNTSAVPYIIQVGALQATGGVSSYTTPGAALWISGFGGEYGHTYPAITTTDQSGCTNGYVGSNGPTQSNAFEDHAGGHSENTSCNYTSTFNGTSSAAPTVAGVVALMLEANPDLTWRDVKHILATTADKEGVGNQSYVLSNRTQYEWETNSAGYEFHNWYGFGKVDAAEAVSTATSYTADSRGTFATTGYSSADFAGSGNNPPEVISYSGDGLGSTLSSISVTKPSGSNDFVEFVRISVQFSHEIPKSIGIRLQSPDNTLINIMQPMTNIGANPSETLFDIGVSGLYGESIEGLWTIAFNDYKDDDTDGVFIRWGIEVYGN